MRARICYMLYKFYDVIWWTNGYKMFLGGMEEPKHKVRLCRGGSNRFSRLSHAPFLDA